MHLIVTIQNAFKVYLSHVKYFISSEFSKIEVGYPEVETTGLFPCRVEIFLLYYIF